MSLLSPSSQSFLAELGVSAASDQGRITDPAAVSAAVCRACPEDGADPCAPETLRWVALAADCLTAMNEQLYEHYRPVADAFRRAALSLRALPDSPVWADALAAGERLGLLRRAALFPVPHLLDDGRRPRS